MGNEEDPNIVDQTIALPGWIMELTIDLFQSTITYHVWVEPEQKMYTIVFSGVSAFYFTRGIGVERFEESWRQFVHGAWAVSEWTSAGYYPKGVGVVNVQAEPGSIEREWVERRPATPNFAIVQLHGLFFIEASKIQVDDQVFEVGYPPDKSM